MKKTTLILLVALISFILVGCSKDDTTEDIDYRQSMRDFVQGISEYSKEINPDFVIIPQNGHELLTMNGYDTGELNMDYINSIDGVGREDLFYGYEEDDVQTSIAELMYMWGFMTLAESNGLKVLVTDYCVTEGNIYDSIMKNYASGYISFQADHRELDNIPLNPLAPYSENSLDITSLSEAMNFLYLLNTDQFSSKEEYLSTLQNTNYDVLIIDLFLFDDYELSESDIASLKVKLNGGSRLVIAYMSIGEAEDYRYYWNDEWNTTSPSWMAEENPNWPGNYKVKYWDESWQSIIYGNDDSYLKMILDAGFDGVYLDIIDAFEYFE